MDLALGPLRTLEAVARHGSFSRAARELNLTQPAVSMQVAQLERRLGLPLLERVGKRAFPTRARELAVTPFYRDELVAIAPPEPRWRRRGTIRAVELAEHPLILFDRASTVRREIDAWFARARVTARAAMELGNTEAMKKFVEAGLGLSVTSEFSVKGDVAARRLAAMRLEPSLIRQIGLLPRPGQPVAPPPPAVLGALEDLRATLARRR